MDHFCYLCFVFAFVILPCLFLVALLSPVGKWADILALLCVIFSYVFVKWFQRRRYLNSFYLIWA